MNMPTEAQLNELLEDLYAIDPELKKYESDLRNMVSQLLESRPDTKFNESFARDLKEKLLLKVAERETSVPWTHRLFKPWVIAPAGVIVLLVAVFASSSSVFAPRGGNLALSTAPTVSRLGERAFGSLSSGLSPAAGVAERANRDYSVSQEKSAAFDAPAGAPLPTSMGFAGVTSMPAPTAPGGFAAGGDRMMVRPDWQPTYYAYTYKGEPLSLSEASLPVLKRVKGASIPVPADLRQALIGLLDLGGFGDAGLQMFTINQETKFGYSISADMNESSVSINRNWTQWPQDEYGLDPGAMPSDEEAVEIAARGARSLGISLDAYGTPSVQNDWRVWYAAAENSTSFRAPETVSVIFPIIVSGQTVHDESGMPFGLTVAVNARHKRVEGVWNLTTNEYQSSMYDAETDAERILKIAGNGGIYGGGWQDPNAQRVEIELGTPERILTKVWKYSNGKNDELLVPALRFPVLNAPKDYWQKNIVIPLIKELLAVPEGGGIGIPTPMPAPMPLQVK